MYTDILLLSNLMRIVEKSAARQNSTGLCNQWSLSICLNKKNPEVSESFCAIF